MNGRGAAALVAGIAVWVGCARVDVRKVPVRSAYAAWSDEDQRRSDSICGQRYYLPRPFLAVEKPFLVGGGDFYARGTVRGQGQLVALEAASLPPALKGHFPSDGVSAFVPTSQMKLAGAPARGFGRAGATAAPTSAAAPGPGASAEKPLARLAPEALSEAAFTPKVTQEPLTAFSLSVTLSKDKYGDLEDGASVGPTPCVIPLDDDGPRTSAFLRLSVAESPATRWSAAASATWKGFGMVKDMKEGQRYVPGFLFKGRLKDDPANQWQLVYRLEPVLTVLNAPPARKKTVESTEEGSEDAAKTRATFEARGDPATEPVIAVNGNFKIVMLPDFEEQYAVNVDGGLGVASAKLGLENGWLLENSEYLSDNRELGKFVFKQLEKFVDLGLEVARSEWLPDVSATGTADELKGEGVGAAGARGQRTEPTVLVRVLYVLEAQPGIYPVLKPFEALHHRNVQRQLERLGGADCGCGEAQDRSFVYVPCPPYTVVAKDVVRRVVVQLVSVDRQAPRTDGQPGTTPGVPAAVPTQAQLREWVAATLRAAAPQAAEGLRSAFSQAQAGDVTDVTRIEGEGGGQLKVHLKAGFGGASSDGATVAAAVQAVLQAHVTSAPGHAAGLTVAVERDPQ